MRLVQPIGWLGDPLDPVPIRLTKRRWEHDRGRVVG
jgi:hypothetical protein